MKKEGVLNHAQGARHVFGFLDQSAQTSGDTLFPEGFVPGVQIEGREEFHDVLGRAGTQKVQIERLEPRPQTLALREKALREQFTESISINVKRAVKMRDIGPEMIDIFESEDFAFGAIQFLHST